MCCLLSSWLWSTAVLLTVVMVMVQGSVTYCCHGYGPRQCYLLLSWLWFKAVLLTVVMVMVHGNFASACQLNASAAQKWLPFIAQATAIWKEIIDSLLNCS